MPKKTKKQKIIAQYHRKLHGIRAPAYVSDSTPEKLSAVPVQKEKKTLIKQAEKNASYDFSIERHYIKTDLTKTFFLSVLAIVCLVVIYLGSTT